MFFLWVPLDLVRLNHVAYCFHGLVRTDDTSFYYLLSQLKIRLYFYLDQSTIASTFADNTTQGILTFELSLTGKTLLAKTLARFVNVPFVIADATTLTQVILSKFSVFNVLLKKRLKRKFNLCSVL